MGELTIKCYADPHECGYCSNDGGCSMYDRACVEIHIDQFREDGEE